MIMASIEPRSDTSLSFHPFSLLPARNFITVCPSSGSACSAGSDGRIRKRSLLLLLAKSTACMHTRDQQIADAFSESDSDKKKKKKKKPTM